MGTAQRASGSSQLQPGELITYAAAGGVERIAGRFDTYRPVVGEVIDDDNGTVTFIDRLPAPITVTVAPGGSASAGWPALVGGSGGYTNCPGSAEPNLGSGSRAHFVAGFFAESGAGGAPVLLHPAPHYCPGGDVE